MLDFVWEQYRIWAVTSAALKKRISNASRLVLALTLVGAALGTFAPILKTAAARPDALALLRTLAPVIPWLSAAALGFATFVNNQVLSKTDAQAWVKTRAVAEALKSEAYKFVMHAPPYDAADAEASLEANAQRIMADVSGLLAEPTSEQDRRKNLPLTTWTESDYATQRVKGQITFYDEAGRRHTTAVTYARNLSLAFGALSVLISVTVANTGAGTGVAAICAALLGVVTTAAAAIGAWFQAGRNQQLALNYQAARSKVELLSARRSSGALTLTQFVTDVESVFQAEHAAWLTEWQSSKPTPAPAKP